jgi:putative transcriptional regulator
MPSLKGQLLVATPESESPLFSHSVILMIEHDEEGAIGVILNQPISATVTDLAGKIFVDDFEWDKPISLGGPVAGSLMVLHTGERLADQEIIPGVYITADGAKVQALIEQRPEPSIVIANFSGWSPGQLEDEIEANSWLIVPATFDHVFWMNEKELWKVVVNQERVRSLTELVGLRIVPFDPSLN